MRIAPAAAAPPRQVKGRHYPAGLHCKVPCPGTPLSDRATRAFDDAGLTFPLVAKPDIGWHDHGVRRIDHRVELENYIPHFPDSSTVMPQRYVPYAAEAAVLYARLPGEAKGRVLSLTLRYFPQVVGNGIHTVRQLIRNDARAQWKSSLHLRIDKAHRGVDPLDLGRTPARGEVVRIALIGNQPAGALYRDGSRHITPALDERFDAIARGMTEFHYGRFDLRFDTVERLMRAEDFAILEISGIGARPSIAGIRVCRSAKSTAGWPNSSGCCS